MIEKIPERPGCQEDMMLTRIKVVAGVLALSLIPASGAAAPATAEPPTLTATLARSYDAFDARQGVAVDRRYFYVVDNRSITKHDRATGQPLLQFASDDDGPIIHMDSVAAVDGRLYAAHSNYDESPMESSIEVVD